MNKLALACLLFLPGTGSVYAQSNDNRVPVRVRIAGVDSHDGLTQNFGVSLKEAIGKDAKLRLATESDTAAISLESYRNVGSDKLAGKTVAIYAVYVYEGEDRGEPLVGVCFETGMSKCVKDILRIVRLRAD